MSEPGPGSVTLVGSYRIRGSVRHRGCTKALCLPPAERAFETTVTVTAAEEG